jgi:hypothetical protein
MSQDVLRRRAAQVRESWSNSERRLRSIASDVRCLDLIVRMTTGGQFRTVPCRVKASS